MSVLVALLKFIHILHANQVTLKLINDSGLILIEMFFTLCFLARVNNFPPLPSFCPVQPCFYQDFSVDIPLEFQRIVKTIYFLWLGMFKSSFSILTFFER